MMKSKSKFMIKYVIFLLTFALIGCHTEPQFANPIEPTENKTETIQKWMGEFENLLHMMKPHQQFVHQIHLIILKTLLE